MNILELTSLLEELAEKDTHEDSDIYDHPCTVAIRAIDAYMEDISNLRGMMKGTFNPKCKRGVYLVEGWTEHSF